MNILKTGHWAGLDRWKLVWRRRSSSWDAFGARGRCTQAAGRQSLSFCWKRSFVVLVSLHSQQIHHNGKINLNSQQPRNQSLLQTSNKTKDTNEIRWKPPDFRWGPRPRCRGIPGAGRRCHEPCGGRRYGPWTLGSFFSSVFPKVLPGTNDSYSYFHF